MDYGVLPAVSDCNSPPPPPSPASHIPNPHPLAIVADTWLLAEQATGEVIRHILPTVVSERRRKAVVEYVQKLIRGFLSSEVFPFGSVPLKTYLPDGDIDLTAVGFPNSEDALAADVRSVLESEERNRDAGFEVKDVQFIHAEVKLVKCLVQNIVIDISFNQIGGLSTLCFLEQVDLLIGKDHLFKRSIILIKAWCYYESRILGAHHGLISTYALEILVLYIFHLFHSSLYGPLVVLYRFLDYYSKFDWDNYCISLNGPVSVSSLPELLVETPDNASCNLLLTKEFLSCCMDSFSVGARGSENNSRIFIKKHLNIVDPLRESNNLGRSVSKGNFYRIRSAFSYGARKLGQLLLLPDESIADEVKLFFLNTMDRHGSGERPDVQDIVPRCLDSMSVEANGVAFASSTDKLQKEGADKTTESLTSDAYGDLSKEIENMKISGVDDYEGRIPMQRASSYKQQNGADTVSDGFEVNGVSFRNTRDLASARGSGSIISENQMSTASTSEAGLSSSGKAYYASRSLYLENGSGRDLTNLDLSHSVSLNRAFTSKEEMNNSVQLDSCKTDSSSSSTSWVSSLHAYTLESLRIADHTLAGNEGKDTNGCPNSLDKFSYLTGDYEKHFSSLAYAQWCQEQVMGSYFLPIHQSPTYPYHRSKGVWNRSSMYTPMNANGVTSRTSFSRTAYYPIVPPLLSSTYGTEDFSKPRGTGTYFPNMNYHVHKERHYPGSGKNRISANQSPRFRSNGRADISHDWSFEKESHEPATQALPVFSGTGPGRPPMLDIPPQSLLRPALMGSPRAIGIHFPPDFSRLEFGSLGPVSVGAPLSEHGRKVEFANSNGQGSGFTKAGSSTQRSVLSSNTERHPQSYRLKDEDDFPPLSG